MSKHVYTAMWVLVVASATGAAANLVRPTSLPWIREVRVSTRPEVPPKPLEPADGGKASSGAVKAAEPDPSKPPPVVVKPPPKETPAPKAGELSAQAVFEHLKNGTARFVDAREQNEWVEGHFRNAIHIPASAIYANIDRIIREVPPHEKVIVYCGGGDCEASHHVADALTNDFKFQDVTVYTKGWQEVDAKRAEFGPYISTGAEP